MFQPAYTEADLRRAATAGIRAPSLHNSQPWLFRLRDGAIEILTDPQRRLEFADESGWAVRIACGAATFNARLGLAMAGTPAAVELRPDPTEPYLIARLRPGQPRPPTYAEQELHAAIPRRYSNRRPFHPEPVPPEIRVRLIEAARTEAAWLELLVGTAPLAAFAEVAGGADRVLSRNPAYQSELHTWIHADAALDGVPVTAGAPATEPQDLLPQRPFSTRRRGPGRDFEQEPLVAVLGTYADRPADQIAAGQALQRVLLTVTQAGLASSMMSQPIEVPAARDQLRRSLGRSGSPQMTMRIGYGDPGRQTPRRQLDEVIIIG